MKKILLQFFITIIASFTCYTAIASHLAGQDLTYVLVDSSGGIYHYRITLNLIQDCYGSPEAIAEDNPAFLAVYTGAGTFVELDSTAYYSSHDTLPVTYSGACSNATGSVCRMKAIFTQDFYLPASASGYIIAYQRCCLNNVIMNIAESSSQGVTATCTIPPSSITTHNNSAVFTNYPPFIIAINHPLVFDCSATDADGDSLSYQICQPYNGASDSSAKPIPAAPPYAAYSYTSPLSYSNPMLCSAPLAIDPVTGQLTCTPDSVGVYLVAVCCNEWRGGVLINTVQRVFEFTVVNCTTGIPLAFIGGSLQVFPNPASKQLNIWSADPITNVIITDVLGQSVYKRSCNTDKVQVDISDLSKGLYFVKINGVNVKKFVKE